MERKRITLALAFVAALTVAACGGDDETAATDTATLGTDTALAPAPAPMPDTAASPTPATP